MSTVLIYVFVTLVVALALFLLSVAVFGRGEMLPPVAEGSTLTRLPEGPPTGDDVRALRFGMSARGYTMAEVDWALERAADEIDRLRAELDDAHGTRTGAAGDAPTR